MKTFTSPIAMVENPLFGQQRRKSLHDFADDGIDAPIARMVIGLNRIPYCFTLQSCYGHFVHGGQEDPNNLDPLPGREVNGPIEYRIAYIALCIENNRQGIRMLNKLAGIPRSDPDLIQFGSATWFWERQVNSYALQVEPVRFKQFDRIEVDYREALRIEEVRGRFFARLADLVKELATSS